MWPFKKKVDDFTGAPVMLERVIPENKVVFIGRRSNSHAEQEFANIMESKVKEFSKDGWELISVTCNSFNEVYAFFKKSL